MTTINLATKIFTAIAFLAMNVSGATNVRLIPAFATQIPGANGSLWQSEIRLYNSGPTTQIVQVGRVFPGNQPCGGFAPVTLEAGALAQIRSIGCADRSAAALEIVADDAVEIASVITNIGATTQQDACCLAGFTQQIPAVPTGAAYATRRTVANLQIPVVGISNIGRHNLVFVNPNQDAVQIALRYFDASGVDGPGGPFPYLTVTVPGGAYLQVNDVLPQPSYQFEHQPFRGFWRIEASAAEPFYFFDSYVDNATNDATTIESH